MKKIFISNICNRFSVLLSQLFLIPFFIKFWGKENYGEWLLLSTLPSYLSNSDFGISVTAVTTICSLVAQKKQKEAIELYKSSNGAFIFLSLIVLSLFLLSCFFLNWAGVMGIKFINEIRVELTLFLLLCSVFLTFIYGMLLGIFRAAGRFDKYLNYITFSYLADTCSVLINLFVGGDVQSIAVCQVIIRIILILLVTYQLTIKYDWFTFAFSTNLRPITSLLPTSVYYLIYTLGQGLLLQGTTFIVGKQLGAVNLVTFNTTRTLVNSIKSFVGIYYSSFLSEFTILQAQENFERAKNIFKKMYKNTIILAVIFIIIYYLLGAWIMQFWTKGKVSIEEPFYIIMLLLSFFNTIQNCAYTILNATNENKKVGIYYSVLVCIAMAIAYYIASEGLVYIAFILLVVELVMSRVAFREAWKVITKIEKTI